MQAKYKPLKSHLKAPDESEKAGRLPRSCKRQDVRLLNNRFFAAPHSELVGGEN